MTRAADTSEQELAAPRPLTDRLGSGETLAVGLIRFCQSGTSVVIASCDTDGHPVVGRGLAVRMDGTGQVRVMLRQSSNTALFQAVRDGGGLAVTFTRPSTHRSIQLKAACAHIGARTAADEEVARAQTASLVADLVVCGYDEALCRTYCAFEPQDLAALEFVAGRVFEQTPGPGAGCALRP